MSTSLQLERDQIQKQIAQLQQALDSLSAGGITASTSRSSSLPASQTPAILSKRQRRAQSAQIGPLPPILAAQPKRHIALLFSYEGWAHSGLAWQPPTSPTPLPTVEGCILEALERARLIEPAKDKEGFGCGFERCGRTDAGVSSSAQVINLWVRSELEDPMNVGIRYDPVQQSAQQDKTDGGTQALGSHPVNKIRKPPSPVEVPYISLLNRHLPPTIRILAWSPVSASFSSRFSCIWRHYKYFFSSSAVQPFLQSNFDYGSPYNLDTSGDKRLEWQQRLAEIDWRGMELDVEAMRSAVARLVGDHDFRNMCKVDPPKQLPTHRRSVVSASIDHVEGEEPDMFVLNLRGGAFLYNQVRHIVALLFLVGARLETPDIIERLLWTSDRTETTERMHALKPGEEREVVDCKPGYAMADDLPLILWQCGFNSTELDWRIDNSPRAHDVAAGSSSLAASLFAESPETRGNGQIRTALDPRETFRKHFLEMNETYTAARIKALVLKHHLGSLAMHCPAPDDLPPALVQQQKQQQQGGLGSKSGNSGPDSAETVFVPVGAGQTVKTSSYIPLLERKRGDPPEVANANWAKGRGARRMVEREARQEEADRVREINLAKKRAAILEQRRLAELDRSAQG